MSFTFTSTDCCSICLENVHFTGIICNTCKKSCHVDCIKEYLREAEKCPMCRTEYPDSVLDDLFGPLGPVEQTVPKILCLQYLGNKHVSFWYNYEYIHTTVENFDNIWNKWKSTTDSRNRPMVTAKRLKK